jgi:hypothetical protein
METPPSLAGATIQWRLETAAGAIVKTLTNGDGIEIVDEVARTIAITIDAADTGLAPGSYRDQCRVTLANGDISTQWTGGVNVQKSFFA